MNRLTWRADRVRLGDLRPWDQNPRRMTKRQAQRLLRSWREFGQVHAIAVGPDGEVYDGHQRLSALLAVYGPDYEVDVRRASRPLTDDERRALVLALHAGATGSWDWDLLSGWDEAFLQEWGFDDEMVQNLRDDLTAVEALLEASDESEEPPPAPDPPLDSAEDLLEKWGVERGQVWTVTRLSVHTIYCADSCEVPWRQHVPELVVTDPPFDLASSEVRSTLECTGVNTAAVLTGGKQAYTLVGEGWQYSVDFIWKNRRPRSSPTRYQPNWHHYHFLIVRRGNGGPVWQRPAPKWPSVYEVEGSEYSQLPHGHAKSADVFAWLLMGFREQVQVVADPFLGSAGVLIACDQHAMCCVGAEMDPAMLAVALERCHMAGFTVELSDGG